MIQLIKDAAASVGVVAFVTNSTDKIETQLNNITKIQQSPIMLVSWDINTSLVFNKNGFLENPSSDIVALLVSKPGDATKETAETVSAEMAVIFRQFIQALYRSLIPFQTQSDIPAISNASYKHVPIHGLGKHSGVLGRFTMRTAIAGNC